MSKQGIEAVMRGYVWTLISEDNIGERTGSKSEHLTNDALVNLFMQGSIYISWNVKEKCLSFRAKMEGVKS